MGVQNQDVRRYCLVCCVGDVLRDMGLRDAFNVQLSVPALNGDAVATVLRSLDCFAGGEILQVRAGTLLAAVKHCMPQALLRLAPCSLCYSSRVNSNRLLLHVMCWSPPQCSRACLPCCCVLWCLSSGNGVMAALRVWCWLPNNSAGVPSLV